MRPNLGAQGPPAATYLGADGAPSAPLCPSHARPTSRQMSPISRRRPFSRFTRALVRATTAHARFAAASGLAFATAASLAGAQTAGMQTIPRNEAREKTLLGHVTVADGFKATLFAAPPIAMYPVCLTGTIEGVVFACVDPNLSLTATKGAGKVVRLVDDNHDGIADRYSVFAQMDSPRGLAYDGRTLYVMHPPNLTAYRDTTGDGVADVSEDIVTGLGFGLDFRGADHTTNGITLGIDGFIYIAVGDYGYRKAVGKDGTTIAHRGGGVVRVRTDGTGLELYAEGTRNIYDLAVDPFLRVYTRDNTNDGDGWDIRLHYLPMGAHMGYPMYYKNFSTEHMQSLADYGNGSGTGGLWVHDPGFPAGLGNTLYTTDWLLNQVTSHPLTPKGASFDVKQDKIIGVPHPADLAMDGQSNMYVASLYGGDYTYSGDTVGYIVRVSPANAVYKVRAAIGSLSDVALRTWLVGGNAEYRLRAQREILRRGSKAPVVAALRALVLNKREPAYARVAAMFTLSQLVGAQSHTTLRAAAADPAIKALALRALVDDKSQLSGMNPALFVAALNDTSASVQVAALAALARMNAKDAASAIVPLTASTDATVAHIAVNALVTIGGSDAALKALDGTTPAVRAGALMALERMHDVGVVNQLIARSGVRTGNSPNGNPVMLQRDIILALARLYHREAVWNGEWWGTRPNFLGPYFAPVTWEASASIANVLANALVVANASRDSNQVRLIDSYMRNRVLPYGATPQLFAGQAPSNVVEALIGSQTVQASALATLTTLSRGNAQEYAAVARLLAAQPNIADGALPLVRDGALNTSLSDSLRAQLVNLITAMPGRPGLEAATGVLSKVNPAVTPAGTPAVPIEAAWRRFVGDRRRLQELDYFVDLSRSADSSARTLAFAVLLQSVRGGRAAPAVNEKVQPVLAAAWASRAAASDLVRAMSIMRLEAAYAPQLEAYRARSGSSGAGLAWQPLFNGKDLKDWEIKFTNHPLGENFRNTFRVENGLLKVAYDQWPDFNGEFGHLFYKQPFSYYIVAVEYRFTGEQVTGAGSGLSWAIRNNGIMVHSQSAASMGLKQDFPISLEVQLLGGLNRGTRTNGNLCTPGTNIVMNDKLVTTHCINSNSITYDGDQWVRVEAMVLGDSVLKHIVNGDTVLTYSKPQMGGGSANNTNPGVLVDGKMLSEGFITLQAESAPIEFRKVEIVNLKGCTNPKDPNFKPYFVKSDPAACKNR